MKFEPVNPKLKTDKSIPSFDPRPGLKNNSNAFDASPMKKIQLSSNLRKFLEFKPLLTKSSSMSNPIIWIKPGNLILENKNIKSKKRDKGKINYLRNSEDDKRFNFLKHENLVSSSQG